MSACTLEAAASAQQSAAEEAGSRAAVGFLKDILLGRMCTGTRASVFTNHLLQLQTSLKLHGFTHAPDSVRECKRAQSWRGSGLCREAALVLISL
jgi:hypothetical protein